MDNSKGDVIKKEVMEKIEKEMEQKIIDLDILNK
jgi:hypothetical protein